MLTDPQQPANGETDEQRAHKQQQLAARLAQLPSSNGHHAGGATDNGAAANLQQQLLQQRPQDDAAAAAAWQALQGELSALKNKGQAGGWLINTHEVRVRVEARLAGVGGRTCMSHV